MASDAIWPFNHKSSKVAVDIDWTTAAPLSFNAPAAVWRKLAKPDAKNLRDDPKYRGIFLTLQDEIQTLVSEIADGKDITIAKAVTKAKKQNEVKDDILSQIKATIEEAALHEDFNAKLKGLHLLAQVEQLLHQKAQDEDRVTIINVITGVERERNNT